MATTSLACRMLAAANAAYLIDGNGNFTPPSPGTNPIYDAVGWTGTPTAIVGTSGLDNQDLNACLVGTSGDGVVVAFRGTLPLTTPPTFEEIMDWLQDFLVGPCTDSTIQTWGSGVMVHPGWWDAVESIASKLRTQLQSLNPQKGSFYFTGHSKGGPLASIAAMNYAMPSAGQTLPVLYTFASPRPGNTAFANAFASAGLTQTRYENINDIAPLLPPSASDVTNVLDVTLELAKDFGKIDTIWYNVLTSLLNNVVAKWDYAAVGSGYYIDQGGNLQPADPAAQWGAVFGSAEAGGLSTIAQAHCAACPASGCQGGYMTGVCPGFCSS